MCAMCLRGYPVYLRLDRLLSHMFAGVYSCAASCLAQGSGMLFLCSFWSTAFFGLSLFNGRLDMIHSALERGESSMSAFECASHVTNI
jgi:hypothetical protein